MDVSLSSLACAATQKRFHRDPHSHCMDGAGEAPDVDVILAISGLAGGEDRRGLGSSALLQPPSALSRAAGPG